MRVTLWSSSLGDIPANLAFVNNFAALVDPTVSNDISQGYTAGSTWINTADGRAFLCYSSAAGAAVWVQDAATGGLGIQGAPAAKTVSATLTAAEIQTGIITVNQAGGAVSNLQLPLATAMDTAFPQSVANSSFDFSVTNLSAVGAEIANLTTNTGWSLVGSMAIAPIAASAASAVRFRARKTATGAWTLYRLS